MHNALVILLLCTTVDALRLHREPPEQGQVNAARINNDAEMLFEAGSLQTMRTRLISSECHNATHDAALVILAPPKGKSDQGDDFKNSVDALRSIANLKDGARADVRVFYDRDDGYTKEDLQQFFAAVGDRGMCAIQIQFERFPDGVTVDSNSPWSKRSKWGYEHMIRFFFVDLLDRDLALMTNGEGEAYKYWMRMDSDSSLKSPVTDPFAGFDKDEKLDYMSNRANKDCGKVALGLKGMAKDYMAKHGIDPSAVASANAKGECVLGFYNNLELGRISSFQSKEAYEWRDAVIASKGIYLHRWGDALLRRLQIEITGMKIQPVPAALYHSYDHKR